MGLAAICARHSRRKPVRFFASATDGAGFTGRRLAVSNGAYDFSSVIRSANSASAAACNMTR